MNQNRNTQRPDAPAAKRAKAFKNIKGLKITFNKAGMFVNEATTIQEVINTVLRGLLAVAMTQTHTPEARTEYYNMFSTAFANFLAAFSPVDHFPATEELEEELAQENAQMEAKLALGMGTDINFEELKEKQLPKIEEARKYAEEHPEFFDGVGE